MSTLHPELARLAAHFHQLREHVGLGELTPAEANESLAASTSADGLGNIWRIDPSGVFTRSAPGEDAYPTDPSLYAATQLPEIPEETGPFPHTIHSGESAEDGAARWAEIQRSHQGSAKGKRMSGARVVDAVDKSSAKLKSASVLAGIRTLDRGEVVLGRYWKSILFWAGIAGLVTAYLLTYK